MLREEVNVLLTVGEQYVMSGLHDLSPRRTWRTMLLRLRQVILENCPRCRSHGQCDYVFVKLVPLESAILPES